MTAFTFKVGDRVVAVESMDDVQPGMVGTVSAAGGHYISVAFDALKFTTSLMHPSEIMLVTLPKPLAIEIEPMNFTIGLQSLLSQNPVFLLNVAREVIRSGNVRTKAKAIDKLRAALTVPSGTFVSLKMAGDAIKDVWDEFHLTKDEMPAKPGSV